LEVFNIENNQTASHISLEEREIIAKSLSNGMSFQMIAEPLSRHPPTISREVKNIKRFPKNDSDSTEH
jgi:IS30 family transposase